MPMAFKTFSLIHSPPQPPGDTTVWAAIKRQLVSSTKWAFKKCAFHNTLLIGSSGLWHFCLLRRVYTHWDISD